jgi:hypothetical protein
VAGAGVSDGVGRLLSPPALLLLELLLLEATAEASDGSGARDPGFERKGVG